MYLHVIILLLQVVVTIVIMLVPFSYISDTEQTLCHLYIWPDILDYVMSIGNYLVFLPTHTSMAAMQAFNLLIGASMSEPHTQFCVATMYVQYDHHVCNYQDTSESGSQGSLE